MSLLCFDTETTGLPVKNKSDEFQPHIVQLAATLFTDDGNVVSQLNHIIKPDGWEIPKEASDIHGITMDIAMKYGLSRAAVLTMFSNLVKRSTLLIAHNAAFDMDTTNRQYRRAGMRSPLLGRAVYCTAEESTNLLKFPPTHRMVQFGYGHKSKKPTLEQLHTVLFSWWDARVAHNAMGDVDATVRCYQSLQKKRTEEEIAIIQDNVKHYQKFVETRHDVEDESYQY